jgi:L-alanine-DL-glutamate epimerase-like enolase superfamily enzyme
LIVALSQNGQTGYGEATAIPYYGLDLQEMVAQLERVRPEIEQFELHTPEAFWEQLQQWLPDAPFPCCALDVAAHDLFGKLQQQTVYQRWGLRMQETPLSSYTIGLASVEEMVQKMQEQPWPLYKIKLGTGNDLAIIQALRKHTDARFRVDANTAWTAEQTIAFAPELKALGVDFIEQPLKVEDWAGMKQVYKQSALPIIADESCQTEADIERCHGYFHGVNIKLMKCGGLTPALRMIERANELGLKTMVGCMTESSVGISAIAQLLPLLDYVDMDGAMLINNDPATGVRLVEGRAVFPEGYGTGAELKG